MIEMILRRLTKNEKAEILEAYKAGYNTNSLAEKYSCTTNTINRTVKNLLSDGEYIVLKEKRSKINNKKLKIIDNETVKETKLNLKEERSLTPLKEEIIDNDLNMESAEEFYNTEVEKPVSFAINDPDEFCEDLSSKNLYNINKEVEINNKNIDNNLELIAPLMSDFELELDKQKLDFEILNCESLPESVYIIVDKKVELELQLISDLPEWNFLPENELKRNAILLFANQRSAKRSCSKNQRVIKVPNTSIFNLLKSYLISKGITRLILDDSLIALDN